MHSANAEQKDDPSHMSALASINLKWFVDTQFGCLHHSLASTHLPRLWLQSDNTVKEIRNGNAGRFAAALTQGNVFTCVSHNHLIVGHTHEDCDALFSVVASCLGAAPTLETPADVIRCISKKLQRLVEDKSMEFRCEMIETVPKQHVGR